MKLNHVWQYTTFRRKTVQGGEKESIKLTSEDDLSEKIFGHLKESVNKGSISILSTRMDWLVDWLTAIG